MWPKHKRKTNRGHFPNQIKQNCHDLHPSLKGDLNTKERRFEDFFQTKYDKNAMISIQPSNVALTQKEDNVWTSSTFHTKYGK